MPAEHMFWGTTTYGKDGTERVPRWTYRCKASARKQGETGTHHCRHVTDHDSDHMCVCGFQWARKVDA